MIHVLLEALMVALAFAAFLAMVIASLILLGVAAMRLGSIMSGMHDGPRNEKIK